MNYVKLYLVHGCYCASYGQIQLTGTRTPACLPQKIKVMCTNISLGNQGTVCGKMKMCRVIDTPPKDMEYLVTAECNFSPGLAHCRKNH